jgi:hypothetical protein
MPDIVAIDGNLSALDVLKFIETGGKVKITVPQESPEIIAERINRQILEASSAEELFGGRTVTPLKDYLGKPFQLTDVEWRPSEYEGEGMPFYAIMHAVTMDGEMLTLSTGARSILLKAAKAQAEGWLPRWVRAVQSEKKTEAGYQPLDLVDAPQDF